ncbi:MAG: tetratricopeptide repeat protein [Bacteroidetes bacterium]|nr:tetratricopeptide repeat protein [Bacteroidota bacterium]
MHSSRFNWLLAAIPLVLGLLAHSNGVGGELLLFDDNQYFESYPEIRTLNWENVRKYFSNHYVIMYHPLPILSMAVQYHFTGSDPYPLHVYSLVLHLLNILLVSVLARRLGVTAIGALIASSVFAVHPMATESVAWFSARSSLMYSLFFMLALIAYIQYIKQQSNWVIWYIICILCAILSFFSKANALPLPFVLLLVDWYLGRRWSWKMAADKLPFLAMSVGFGLMALSDQGTSNNLYLGAENHGIFHGLLFSSYSLWHYLVHFFIPYHLSAIHTYPLMVEGTLPIAFYLAPLGLAILVFVLWRLKPHRSILFATLFFGLVISVTLQVVPSRLFMMADRYTYLPYVGFVTALGHGLGTKAKSWHWILLCGWIAGLTLAAHHRNTFWNNTLTLVNDIIDKNPEHPYLSRAFGIRALELEKKGDWKHALADQSKAIALRPTEGQSYYNRGRLHYNMNRYDLAKSDFEKALEILGPHHDLWNYLAGIAFNQKRFEDAVSLYKKALLLNDNRSETWRNLGASQAMIGKLEKALGAFDKALALSPGDSENYRMRGLLYLRMNLRDSACDDLLRAKLLGAKTVDELIEKNRCQ